MISIQVNPYLLQSMSDSYINPGDKKVKINFADGLSISKKSLYERFLLWFFKPDRCPDIDYEATAKEVTELADKIWNTWLKDSGKHYLYSIGMDPKEIKKHTDEQFIALGRKLSTMPAPEIETCPTCHHEI